MIEHFRLRSLAFCLGLLGTIPAIAQSSTREEKIVRNDYAKISLLSGIGVVTEISVPNRLHHSDGATVAKNMADKVPVFTLTNFVPVFTLTNFQVGPCFENRQ